MVLAPKAFFWAPLLLPLLSAIQSLPRVCTWLQIWQRASTRSDVMHLRDVDVDDPA